MNKGCILIIEIIDTGDSYSAIKEATRLEQKNTAAKLKPFDNTLLDDLSMYDKMPYTSNYDLCNSNTVCKESGNLLKSYRVSEKEPYIIKQDENRFHVYETPAKETLGDHESDTQLDNSESLTAEQLESLLEDPDQ